MDLVLWSEVVTIVEIRKSSSSICGFEFSVKSVETK